MESQVVKKTKKLVKEHEWFELLTGKELIKPNGYDNYHGLRYPKEYVNAVKGCVAVFPPKITATFIQKYSKQVVDKRDSYWMQMAIQRMKVTDYDQWTAMDLGMLAYMIIKCNDEDIKKIATEAYESYNIYLGNQILQIVKELEKEKNEYSNESDASKCKHGPEPEAQAI